MQKCYTLRMVARNPRINATFEQETANKSVSGEASEIREDFYLSKLAERLDVEGVKTSSHEDAWM